ncbi:TPA: hypothetical protein ACF29G_003834 [Yersinia enterocolitica]
MNKLNRSHPDSAFRFQRVSENIQRHPELWLCDSPIRIVKEQYPPRTNKRPSSSPVEGGVISVRYWRQDKNEKIKKGMREKIYSLVTIWLSSLYWLDFELSLLKFMDKPSLTDKFVPDFDYEIITVN